MASLEPQTVQWLWEPYLPLGKMTLLEGDPGVGKTWLALAIAAAVSRGWPLPGEGGGMSSPVALGNIIYLTAEDGLADTLRPRLDRAGADANRVLALDGMVDSSGRRDEVTLADVDVLEKALEETSARLVIIDPIQGFLGANIDMHRANEVRPVLAGLARLAEAFECSILAIRHLRKSSAERAVHRGLGSIDFSAAVRSILLVGKDPDPGEKQRRIIAHEKSNLAVLGPSQAFEIRDGEFCWAGTSELGVDELITVSDPHKRTARDEARDFLLEELRAGPVMAKEMRRRAEDAGHAWATITRAKSELRIESERMGGIADNGQWRWILPEPQG